jgi:hypothetical protein
MGLRRRFEAESRKSHFKTRTSDCYDSLELRISRSIRHCRVLNPGVTLSFVASELGAATWWSVKNLERKVYPFYLYCTVCCRFCQATCAVMGMEPDPSILSGLGLGIFRKFFEERLRSC